MTIHELSTCHRYGLGVKIVVINNQWLGMVRQWQDMIYRGRRAQTDLGDPGNMVKRAGDTRHLSGLSRDCAGLSGQGGTRLRQGELRSAYQRMLADPNEPYLLDVIVRPEENVYPMIPAGATYETSSCQMTISKRIFRPVNRARTSEIKRACCRAANRSRRRD